MVKTPQNVLAMCWPCVGSDHATMRLVRALRGTGELLAIPRFPAALRHPCDVLKSSNVLWGGTMG